MVFFYINIKCFFIPLSEQYIASILNPFQPIICYHFQTVSIWSTYLNAYKQDTCHKIRDVKGWIISHHNYYITVNKNSSFTMRLLCHNKNKQQPSICFKWLISFLKVRILWLKIRVNLLKKINEQNPFFYFLLFRY